MLTDKAVKAAKPAPGNRYRKLADQGGLYLFCTVDGTRSWRYDYRLAGQRRPMSPATLNVMFGRLKLTVSPHSLRATAATLAYRTQSDSCSLQRRRISGRAAHSLEREMTLHRSD